MPRDRRAGPHRATYFFEGWAVDCECGWQFTARTRAECRDAFRAHKADPERH